MKNILAENLLRFGVRNLSESDRKTLMEAVSAPGSYKSQINATTIATVSFSINDKTLSLTSNGELVGQWTLVNPYDVSKGPFLWKPGPNVASKAFDNFGNIINTTQTILMGTDKPMFTALTEALNTQPPTSPWNQPLKNTANKTVAGTYSEMIKSKFQRVLKGLSDGGVKRNLVANANTKIGEFAVRTSIYYTIATKEYLVYLAPGMGGTTQLKFATGAQSSNKNVDTAVNDAFNKLLNRNKSTIPADAVSSMKRDVFSTIVPTLDALVKQL
jgi:hypothetical protein